MPAPKLTASNLWRAAECPASVTLPWARKEYADAARGQKEHARLEANPPPGSIPEVAFAFNVLSGRAREVGRSIGREYGELAEGEIPGTTDLITPEQDHLLVTDFKTGAGFRVKHPTENLQLQHNAICAMAVYGKPRAILQIIFTRTGEVLDAELDIFDVAEVRERLRAIWEACREPEPAVNPGEYQCWRCPAMKACPNPFKKARAA